MLLLKASTTAERVEKWTRYSCRSWSKLSADSTVSNDTSFPIARRKPEKELPLQDHAQMWANWLARFVEAGNFPETLNPLSGELEGSASQTLQENVHLQLARFNKSGRYRLSDLPVPGTAGAIDIAATAYRIQTLRYCDAENTEQLADVLRLSMNRVNCRTDWRAFWLSISALAGSPENNGAPSNRLVRRRAVLPCEPNQRLPRLSALLDWHIANPEADLDKHITYELQWLSACQAETGAFNILTAAGTVMYHSALSAEIPAKASIISPDLQYQTKAKHALVYLTNLALKSDDACAGLRTSTRNSLTDVALTSTALGAYCAFAELPR